MVNQWTGEWSEEADYSTYPKEEWCMYDHLANEIRKSGYKIKTTMENLITIILLSVDGAVDDGVGIDKDNPKDIIEWVRKQGGFIEFDYEA